MKMEKTEKRVTPGNVSYAFSLEDTKVAMFIAAYERPPTEDEMKRINVRVHEGYGRRGHGDWELLLTLTDKDETE